MKTMEGIFCFLQHNFDDYSNARVKSLWGHLKPYCKSHCAKDLLIVKKIQPNLIPSKTIPNGCVDLNYKTNLQSVIGLGR